MRVNLLPDGRVRISGRIWSGTYGRSRLSSLERLYRRLFKARGREDDRETADGLTLALRLVSQQEALPE